MIGYNGYHKKIKGSNVHTLVTSTWLPISIQIGGANEHDSMKLIPLIEGIDLKGQKELYGDKAYDTFIVRTYLKKKQIKAQIPKGSRKRKPGRPHSFNQESYNKYGSTIERFFAWLK